MTIGVKRSRVEDPEILRGDKDVSLDPSEIIRDDLVMNDLYKIAKKYTDSVDEKARSYAEERVKGDFESDEELLGKARESLDKLYGDKRRTLEGESERKRKELNDEAADYEIDRAAAQRDLRDRYLRSWDNKLDALSRRGITHSSIADLTAEDHLARYESAARGVDSDFDRKVTRIERKIEKLNGEYEDALKSYEITYAIKLEDKLKGLKSERDKLVRDYRRDHADEREKAYADYLMREAAQSEAYERSVGDYEGEKRDNYLERYDYLVDALNGKNKARVARFIKDNREALEKYLGLYYDRFVKEVS